MPAHPDGPTGVGGWLYFFGFTCLIGGIVSLVSSAQWNMSEAEWANLVEIAPLVVWLRGYESVYGVVAAAGLWWLVVLLVRPRTTTALWCAAILCVLAALAAVDWVLSELYFADLRASLASYGESLDQAEMARLRGGALRSIAVPLLWLLYFQRSKRVRNTFGVVSWDRFRVWLRGEVVSERLSLETP